MNRIDSLDWQRGLLAFSIMLYHLAGWQLGALDASTLLGRLGIYGVSMFFVLSGLSMALVYHSYIKDMGSSAKFFVRRIFRIWPLLWCAVAFASATAMMAHQTPSPTMIALNLTTAFGFVAPSAYMNAGAWSIGNEMVYYAFTPLLIFAFNKRVLYGNLLTAAAVVVGIWFAGAALTSELSLASQWALYINPFNNFFLYCAGVALYYNADRLTVGNTANVACLLIGITVFLAYPVVGDQIHLVTGVARAVFSLASVLLVFAFYKNRVHIPTVLSAPLTQLGVVTYGVYLLHPIVYQCTLSLFKRLAIQVSPHMSIAIIVALTIVLAMLAFKLLEEPMIRLGKKLTSTAVTSSPKVPTAATSHQAGRR